MLQRSEWAKLQILFVFVLLSLYKKTASWRRVKSQRRPAHIHSSLIVDLVYMWLHFFKYLDFTTLADSRLGGEVRESWRLFKPTIDPVHREPRGLCADFSRLHCLNYLETFSESFRPEMKCNHIMMKHETCRNEAERCCDCSLQASAAGLSLQVQTVEIWMRTFWFLGPVVGPSSIQTWISESSSWCETAGVCLRVYRCSRSPGGC